MLTITKYFMTSISVVLMTVLTLATPLLSLAEDRTLLQGLEQAILLGDTKPIEITYEKQVHLNVANEAVNRINFGNFRVTKIIGNISGFNSILSDNGSDLFIVPSLPSGKKIDFSALLSSGDVIDFSLTVVSGKVPYLIKLKLPSNLSANQQHKSEAVKMIEAMSSGMIDKYYVQNSLQKTSSKGKVNIPLNALAKSKIKIIAQDSYRYGNLFGISLTLQNPNRMPCIVTADDLVDGLKSVLAAWIEKENLPPKVKTKAFLVFRGRGE